MKVEKEFAIPSSPEDQKKIRQVMETISDSYTRIEAERDLIKDEIAGLAEKYELPKKLLSKMARTFHKNNYDEKAAEEEDFQNLYETIVVIKNPQ